MPTLNIRPVDSAEADLWRLAREVSGILRNLSWALIGGLMVRIVEAERGITTQWTTGDVDAVLDIRGVSTSTVEASRRLMAAGFEPEREGTNLAYRFVRGNDVVDLLAPDNMGARANLTTMPPDATMEALGSRQARMWGRTPGPGPLPARLPPDSTRGDPAAAGWPGGEVGSRPGSAVRPAATPSASGSRRARRSRSCRPRRARASAPAAAAAGRRGRRRPARTRPRGTGT